MQRGNEMIKIHQKVIGSKFMYKICTMHVNIYALKQLRSVLSVLLTLYQISNSVDVLSVTCSSRSATS